MADKREEILLKAKPILFNTDMIRAILDGRKTVTRRVLKNQDPNRIFNFDYVLDKNSVIYAVDLYCDNGNNGYWTLENKAPYFEGDILYVRETFANLTRSDGTYKYVYKSTDEYPFGEKYIVKFKWHPSIHMPKEAARIFLRVTNVRVERLQDITESEAEKEGLQYYDDICQDEDWHPTFYDPDSGGDPSTVAGFSRLWDRTIKKSDIAKYGWAANPYVWVIEFERIDLK